MTLTRLDRTGFLSGVLATVLILPATQAMAGEDPASSDDLVRQTLQRYCLDCHSGTEPEGELSIDTLVNGSGVSSDNQLWGKIAVALKNGQMPPGDAEQPDEKTRQQTVVAIKYRATSQDCKEPHNPGRVTLRRLNRHEYRNTMRDLLGIDFTHTDELPEDDIGYGFDNIGDVLTIAPLAMEKYLAAAEEALRHAVVEDVTIKPATQNFEPAEFQRTPEMKSDPGWLTHKGQLYRDVTIARPGRYDIRVWAWESKAGPDAAEMAVKLDDRELVKFSVTARKDNPKKYATTVTLEKGSYRIAIEFLNDFWDPTLEDHKDRNLFVDSLEVVGPLNAQPPRLPESHRRIFFVQPTDELAPEQAAEKIIRRFANRAFRRPLTQDELQRLRKLFRQASENGKSFESSIKLALTAVLASPHFLFRVELDRAPTASHRAYRIGDYELASRLSYFLWSSMPDQPLFDLAAEGRLHQPRVLQAQVRRMLKDPKSISLVDNFAAQWLQLRNLDDVQPNDKLFPFDDRLRSAIGQEARLIFATVLREDRSVLEFVDADYTFLNDRLAQHYGIADVQGDSMRRVQLANRRRGGVLTTAAVLTMTSDPGRTSPVKRGKWILEQILGTPAPPPMPDVPMLEASEAHKEGLSLRQQLQQHTSDAKCAACHQRLDPLGFALENYDAVGRWRDQDGKHAVDASAQLPDGTRFAGPLGLKDVLLGRKHEFVQCISEKMLTYALGRGLEHYDQCAVRKIAAHVTENDHKFSALVAAVVESVPFQYRQAAQQPGEQDE